MIYTYYILFIITKCYTYTQYIIYINKELKIKQRIIIHHTINYYLITIIIIMLIKINNDLNTNLLKNLITNSKAL